MRGPHRQQGYTELCMDHSEQLCRSPATGACMRCSLPLCHTHLPGGGSRCGECEADFASAAPSDKTLVQTESHLVSAGSIAAGLGLGLLSGLGATWVVSLTALTLLAGHWFRMMAHLATPGRAGLSSWLLRGRRKRFLRQRSLPSGRAHKRLAH